MVLAQSNVRQSTVGLAVLLQLVIKLSSGYPSNPVLWNQFDAIYFLRHGTKMGQYD